MPIIAQPGQSGCRLPRAVFFGRRCQLSAIPLAALIERGIEVGGIVLTASPNRPGSPPPIRRLPARLPLARRSGPPDVDGLAARTGIPLFEAHDLHHPETLATIGALQPDLLLVSCFARRLPAALLALAPGGSLNLHPSLLPRHRGPDPLFWAYRMNERVTGVTIHQLSPRLDAGDIVAQRTVDIPSGLPGDELERRCAAIGGDLLAAAALQLPAEARPPQPQDEATASYESWPTADDLLITEDWTTAHAYSFIQGVLPLGYTPLVALGGNVRTITAMAGPSTGPVGGDVAELQLRDGVVRVRIEPD